MIDLDNGTEYTFTVAAENVDGPGAQSNSATATPQAALPAAPVIDTVTPVDTGVQVAFSLPAPDASITGFLVQALDAGGVVVGDEVTVGAAARTATVTGLVNDVPVQIRVSSVNAAGTTAESALSAPVTPVSSTTVPGAPTDVTAVAAAESATVSWTPPADAGGTGITGYLVEALTGGAVADSVEVGAVTSTVVGGLTNDTAYTFRVSAINAVGTGDASAESDPPVTPEGVATVPSAPSGTTVTGTNGATATITWQAPAYSGGSPITDYRVIATRVDGAGNPLRTTRSPFLAPDALTYDMGVAVAGDYRFQVIARNAIGTSRRSTSTAVVALGAASQPGAPFIGTAAVGSGTVPGITADVTWTPPVADGGSPITGYRVLALRLNDAGGVAATTRSTWQPADSRSLEMEVPVAATYTFQVITRNDIGTSRRSARSNEITLGAAAPATRPAAPRIGTATGGAAGGDITASVTWTEPTTDGGSAITEYRGIFLQLGANGQVVSTTRTPWQPATAREVEQTLPAEATYVVQVVARNDIGVSRRSVRSNQVLGQ